MPQPPGSDRVPIEVLADQFLSQQRRGAKPSIADYVARYPELAEEIRELFPAVLALERLKSQCEFPSSGRISLGPEKIERLGDFCLLREIGRGGMGVVYEALHESLGRHVAVKVLPQRSSKQCRAFEREARTAARLHHTNIVPLFGMGEHDRFHYLVMQLIRGVDLEAILVTLRERKEHRVERKQLLPRSALKAHSAYSPDAGRLADSLLGGTCVPPLEPDSGHHPVQIIGSDVEAEAARRQEQSEAGPADATPSRFGPKYWRQVAGIARQAAEALQYAHAHRTLHRDIKPANLLLDSQGVVWITDFGLAKAMDDDLGSHANALAGTLRYMAPEQFSDQCDHRSDIYSLGLTIYELLTLKPAFWDSSRSALIRKITQESPRSPTEFEPELPRDLVAIVMKSIARDPSQRYASAGELADDLTRFLEDRPVTARPLYPIETAWRWARRNRIVALLSSVSAAFLLTTAIFATLQSVQRTKALAIETQLRSQAETERARAEANLSLAAKAFDDLFHKASGGMLSGSFDDALEGAALEPESARALQPAVVGREATILAGLLTFYDQFAQQNAGNLRWQQETAEAFWRAGEIQLRLGHDHDAETAGHRALEIYQRLSNRNPANPEYLAGVAATRNLLAKIAWETGRRDIAFLESRQAWQGLTLHPTVLEADASCRIELARAYNRYAVTSSPFSSSRGLGSRFGTRSGDGRVFLRKSQEIAAGLLHDYPENVEYALTLAESYRSLWSLEWRAGQRQAAQFARGKAIDLLQELAARYAEQPECRFLLAEVILLPFRFAKDEALPHGADLQAAQAVEIATELVDHYPQVPKYRAALAESLWAMSMVLARSDSPSEAGRDLDQAIRLQNAIIQENPSRQRHHFELLRFMRERVHQAAATGDLRQQRASLEELIQAIEMIPSAASPSAYLLRAKANAYEDLAQVLRKQGEIERAGDADSKARELKMQTDRSPPRPPRPPRTASS